jgi:uncharacterized membrane protein
LLANAATPLLVQQVLKDLSSLRSSGRITTITVINIKLSLVVLTIIGVASVQAGTVHAGHTTVHTGGHGNYHGNYHGGNGYYANGGHSVRYWRGGYYGGQYYGSGYYPYNSPFFIGLPIPIPFFIPGFN